MMTYPASFGHQPPGASARHGAALPWLIVGLVALAVAGGIGLIIGLQDTDIKLVADKRTESNSGDADGPVSDRRSIPSPPADCLVECTETDLPGGSGGPDTEPNYAGSKDAALDFMAAFASGDVVSAHEALCGAGKDRFPTPEDLAADFYETFGVMTITGARLTDAYAADASADAVLLELETDSGDLVAEVYVVEEGASLTVCGYDIP